MAKVTVLIAAYNAASFIEECLDSLRAQTLKDFQAVCIDDGSTDHTLSILESYAKDDSRFEIIHLEKNQGQAHARNIGLQQAKSKYTCFLDSDDFLSPDALEKMVEMFEKNENTDCVLFQLQLCNEDKTKTEDYPQKPFTQLSGYEAFLKSLNWEIHGIYAVRTSIHQRYPYDESSLSYSDDNTTRLHYLASREVRTCEGVYYYRQHPKSVTHQVSLRRFDYLRANMSMRQQLLELNIDASVIDAYENVRWLNVVGLYMFYFQNRKSFNSEEREYGLNEIKTVWKSIETNRLTLRNRLKFGYMPLQPFWLLFRLQEEIYFGLRSIFRKEKEASEGNA
ncbi:MAG: glycosyltransferase family 2 protein [Prevotella sp.]|nr:glycosyltransferase family 2 protein [Prevotella sp.]